MKFIYFVGTAGSGKSTLVGAYKEWLEATGVDSVVINLDPGVDSLPYDPDVDIRDWIALDEVMSEFNLGPNGAQIVASDLMAVNISKMRDVVDELDATYALVDTPGQLELFAFRESSRAIVDAFGKENSMVIYLSDPMLCRSSNGFISNMVLASLVQFRLELPIFNILTKIDVLDDAETDRLVSWYSDPESLYDDLLDNDSNPQTVVGTELFKALENLGTFGEMRAVSAVKSIGLEEIYAASQLQFFGGDDADIAEDEADKDIDDE